MLVTYYEIMEGMKEKCHFPNNLENLRKAANLTQQDIGNVLGVHRGYVSRWEKGEVQITYRIHRQLKAAFGWTASMIFGDIDPPTVTTEEVEKIKGVLDKLLTREFDRQEGQKSIKKSN